MHEAKTPASVHAGMCVHSFLFFFFDFYHKIRYIKKNFFSYRHMTESQFLDVVHKIDSISFVYAYKK